MKPTGGAELTEIADEIEHQTPEKTRHVWIADVRLPIDDWKRVAAALREHAQLERGTLFLIDYMKVFQMQLVRETELHIKPCNCPGCDLLRKLDALAALEESDA